MIPDQILLFIIMLLLSYIFEGKLILQIVVFSLALFELFNTIVLNVVVELSAWYAFLFVLNVVVAVAYILLPQQQGN